MGIGPANLSSSGYPISSSCAYYTVKAVMQDPLSGHLTQLTTLLLDVTILKDQLVDMMELDLLGKTNLVYGIITHLNYKAIKHLLLKRNSFEQSFVDFSTTY
jgi:hypothetical protein